MFDKEFYPTPSSIAIKMQSLVKNIHSRKILEPSAGKGDLIKTLDKRNCKVIEKSLELRAILKEKGFTIISDDFLEYEKEDIFDCILMNPPFSNGDKHLLHAWDILEHGDIVCLLNHETIKNPYTSTRQLLSHIIAENGTVYELGDCFADAERKTNVNIVMVHLKKDKSRSSIFCEKNFQFETTKTFNDTGISSEIAIKDVVGNLLLDYEMCKEILTEVLPKISKLTQIYNRMAGGCHYKDALPIYGENITESYNESLKLIKKHSWKNLFKLTEMENLLTSKVQDDFRTLLSEQENMSLSRKNIESILHQLFTNRHLILESCIVESFDHMTKYYKENRCHIEGWKTNDNWRVNKKVILPNVVRWENKWGSANTNYYAINQLCDIDRAIASLEGKRFEQIISMKSIIDEHYRKENFFTELFESEYFNLKFYKKGTLHMTFKDTKLWEKFNLVACKGKNWLPE